MASKTCPECGSSAHLTHPQIEKKLPEGKDLMNDHAPHLHHPQIPVSPMEGGDSYVEKVFDPKKGFEK